MLEILFAIICTWAFSLKLIYDRQFYLDCRRRYILCSTVLTIIWHRWITKPINIYQVKDRFKLIFHDGKQYCQIFLKRSSPIASIKGVETKEDYTLELESYFTWEQDYPSPKILNIEENLEVKYQDDTVYAVQNEC